MKKSMISFLIAVCGVFASSPRLFAQTISGTVSGVDLIQKAVYVMPDDHRPSKERVRVRVVWDSSVPGKDILERIQIGQKLSLEVEEAPSGLRAVRVETPFAETAKKAEEKEFNTPTPIEAPVAIPESLAAPVIVAPVEPVVSQVAPLTAADEELEAPEVEKFVSVESASARRQQAAAVAIPMQPVSVMAAPEPPPIVEDEPVAVVERIPVTKSVPPPQPPRVASPDASTARVATSYNFSANNRRPLGYVAGTVEPQERKRRTPILGFVVDSVNGAARSIEGAVDTGYLGTS